MDDLLLYRRIIRVLEESHVPHQTLPPTRGHYFWQLPLPQPQNLPVAAMMWLKDSELCINTMTSIEIPPDKLPSANDYVCSLHAVLTLTTPKIVDGGLFCESPWTISDLTDFDNRLFVMATVAPLQALIAGTGLKLVVETGALGSSVATFVEQQIREMESEFVRIDRRDSR